MSMEDIKVGETYNLPVIVTDINEKSWFKVRTIEPYTYTLVPSEAKTLRPIGQEASKYDPCRKFKKGDKVRYEPKLGRSEPCITKGTICTVLSSENGVGRVFVEYANDEGVYTTSILFCFLELVTPVEELEPYYVRTNKYCSTCTIFKKVGEKKLVHSAYYFVHGNGCSNAIMSITEAIAAAEAECGRLNAEHRKEQDNDR